MGEMMGNIQIRLATREDRDHVLALLRACFGNRDFFHEAWYDWFNYDCPTGRNRNHIAIDDTTGLPIAAEGLLPIRIKINGSVIDGSYSTNVMTHPDYQRRGLYTQLAKHCLAAEKDFGSRMTLGVPNQNSYPGHLKVGWRILSDLTFIAKHSFRNESCKSVDVPAFDAGVDDVINHVAAEASFMVVKDHHFLNWRYQQRPDRAYKLFVFKERSNIEGYAVLKNFDDDGYKKTHILDIMATTEEAFDDLILAAERCAAGSDELNCWQIANSIYEHFFVNNGFAETSQKDVLIMHTNYGEEIEPYPSNWWFALGDNDVY